VDGVDPGVRRDDNSVRRDDNSVRRDDNLVRRDDNSVRRDDNLEIRPFLTAARAASRRDFERITKDDAMNPLQPLMALLAQTERERDEAWAAMQQAGQAQQNAAAQSEQLLAYRREYEQRWSTQFKTDGRIELVHCYRGFMDRLTQAVEQQKRIAEQASVQFERTRAALAEQEMRVASVRKLIERRRQEQRLNADRAEQKQTDEFGSRMAWGTPTAAMGFGLPRPA
jgi:flagellar FliJ protein